MDKRKKADEDIQYALDAQRMLKYLATVVETGKPEDSIEAGDAVDVLLFASKIVGEHAKGLRRVVRQWDATWGS